MKEKKHYFSLRIKGGNVYHPNGKRLNLTDRIVNIGETLDCDVHYDSDCQPPEYYASIIRNDDGKSWRIVKRSQHIDISIAGKGTIGYAHQLADGDIILFDDNPMALCFQSHYDDKYDEEDKVASWQWVVVGVVSLMAMAVVALLFNSRSGSIGNKDVEPLEESIYVIKVDSVRRMLVTNNQEKWLPPTKILDGDAPTGTAFMTADGKMITARHCVEYWIGTNVDLTARVADFGVDDIVRWAIEAETFNQLHEKDSVIKLQVFFSLFDFMGNKKYSFTSTDKHVHMNTDNDGIFMLADFNKDYYWRTIRPYFKDRRMELGDVLWIDGLKEQGQIKMATPEQIREVKNGEKLMICGYPMTGICDKRMTFTEGTIRRNVSVECENLFFESNINHGFSGGPVLMKAGSDVVAIGVVSRVDSISNGLYKWAVPITEVKAAVAN